MVEMLAEPPDGSGLHSWAEHKARIIEALRLLTTDDGVKGQ